MEINDKTIEAFRIWWLLFGTDWVHQDALTKVEPIYGGFVWSSAQNSGYLEYSGNLSYRLTEKTLKLIRGYDHGQKLKSVR